MPRQQPQPGGNQQPRGRGRHPAEDVLEQRNLGVPELEHTQPEPERVEDVIEVALEGAPAAALEPAA